MNAYEHPYPFSAIVGQEDLKLALLVNAVSPEVGGVLVRGEKGTAKSTAVRALASLLPSIRVVSGCPYSCDPAAPNPECPAGPHQPDAPTGTRPVRLVELPVGASTDRLAGTLDIEKALSEGRKAFEPGLLAAAHRGILYVDEVNLLSDHLVDLLLDVAAMGVNHVEREGVSVRHPSRFILVGTMNPEEGELRPQLLDRFGVTVEVSGSPDPADRVEVVRRRLRYEADPAGFAAGWSAVDGELATSVESARLRLPEVGLDEEILFRISTLCAELGVDGLRGDLVTARTARTLAAWEARDRVVLDDVKRAAMLALSHRRRHGPFEQPGMDPEELENALSEDPDPPDGPGGATSPPVTGEDRGEGSPRAQDSEARTGAGERSHASTETFDPVRLEAPEKGKGGPLGRRSRISGETGHPVADREYGGSPADVALAATIRAAAPHQRARGREGTNLVIRAGDLRENVREGKEGNLILFLVDASGSMAARKRMSAVKGAVLSLLNDAYQRRDKVALISFRKQEAKILLPPTSSVELAAPRLEELPTGGRTPLAAGLEKAAEVLKREEARDRERRPLLVLLTDGKATTGPDPLAGAARLRSFGTTSFVVDTEEGYVRLGMAGELAGAMGARCLRLEELRAESLVELVERRTVA
ncbi:MAG: ChlI component of cobalt chelatase involved in B12 biosynthesis / ChlD component of cobalt chelatase involved in B12 biosynthesis [uncultured Rubrobacteraceae bacterium]|uniref:Mg-protoporphyrin IX chelatase n=1 Tax=uncultured Rubrobacteraceae bacterium TaxID=349277 RepID=A0A6J4QZY3_9ACTN|nr:MAG: ChlI component of cobalt chelatase involved in B12 biosynthesis / ChlD component of cobalt chelatase involved in B12 biosynthesis [uncultured Rubrobacteraceae bacterium]